MPIAFRDIRPWIPLVAPVGGVGKSNWISPHLVTHAAHFPRHTPSHAVFALQSSRNVREAACVRDLRRSDAGEDAGGAARIRRRGVALSEPRERRVSDEAGRPGLCAHDDAPVEGTRLLDRGAEQGALVPHRRTTRPPCAPAARVVRLATAARARRATVRSRRDGERRGDTPPSPQLRPGRATQRTHRPALAPRTAMAGQGFTPEPPAATLSR